MHENISNLSDNIGLYAILLLGFVNAFFIFKFARQKYIERRNRIFDQQNPNAKHIIAEFKLLTQTFDVDPISAAKKAVNDWDNNEK